jgi:hypothetical protein
MSKTWKWILGVLAALVIIGVVTAAVFVWWNHAPLALARRVTRVQQFAQPAPSTPVAPGTPGVPNTQPGAGTPYWYGRGDRGYFFGPGGRMPMMAGRGFRTFGGMMPFGMGFFLVAGLLRLIIPLGILVLVAILFYQLGKRAGASSSTSAPPSAPAPSDPPRPGRKVAKV